MGASGQQSVSATGTVDTALSEARSELREAKSEESSGAARTASHSQSYGRKTQALVDCAAHMKLAQGGFLIAFAFL
eukprot:scaffold58938_cov40-Prasinocladus_malaysianus.AAC.1